ncbi:phage terminase small subunit P27 family [Sinorhizobium meliloti]|uniref:phage terminase small subunit P27 family n=1 Tax=Rhizobium meliloti TaxID=382 RepID=UPI0020733BBA|nr:phage terminase small subunit P27 family [Sinorhizobium meliloti]MCM5691429.1 phage terminase small subunit P27 family [Sinorhizobium meliloti]
MSHHTRGRKADPKPADNAIRKVPKSPAYFSAAAKAEWRRIMPTLVERRVLSPADLHAAERFCDAAGDIAAAREAIAKDGAYINDRHGEMKRHPAYATLREATAESRRWAAELGLTPASRSRVTAEPEAVDDDDSPLSI